MSKQFLQQAKYLGIDATDEQLFALCTYFQQEESNNYLPTSFNEMVKTLAVYKGELDKPIKLPFRIEGHYLGEPILITIGEQSP
jgi:hypothetical protein